MDAGKNATPNCHLGVHIVSIIQIGKDGSSIAMPILANVIAPFGRNISVIIGHFILGYDYTCRNENIWIH